MTDPHFEISEDWGAWHWSLRFASPAERQMGPATGFLTRAEAEADATRAAEAMQVAASAWLAEHPPEAGEMSTADGLDAAEGEGRR